MKIDIELWAKGDDTSFHVYRDKEWGEDRITICIWTKNPTCQGDADRVISLTDEAASTLASMMLTLQEYEDADA